MRGAENARGSPWPRALSDEFPTRVSVATRRPSRVLSRAVRFFVAFSGILLALTACSGSDVQVQGNTVSSSDLAYPFGPTGSSWRSIQIEGNDAAWFDGDTRGTVHVDHTCERSQDTPLAALVNHLLIGFTDREVVSEETVPFDQREARHVVVRARLDGVPRTIELYVMKKDGCVYDLGYVAPPDRYESGRGAFDAFVRGFHVTRSPMGPR